MKNVSELTHDIDSLTKLVDQSKLQNMYSTLAYYEYFYRDELRRMRDSVSRVSQEIREKEERKKQKELQEDTTKQKEPARIERAKPIQASLVTTFQNLFKNQEDTLKKPQVIKNIGEEQKKALLKRQPILKERPSILKDTAPKIVTSPQTKDSVTISPGNINSSNADSLDQDEIGEIANVESKKVTNELIRVPLDTSLYASTEEAMAKYFEKRLAADGSIISSALANARNVKNGYTNAKAKIRNYQKTIYKFTVEKHKKYAQSFACIVMFLIGAPLGAIIKRGGLGVPVIVSIFFFIVYYVITITSHKWAKEGFVDGRISVWYANMILLPIGMYFLNRARVDARVFDIDIYLIWFDKFKKRFSKQKELGY